MTEQFNNQNHQSTNSQSSIINTSQNNNNENQVIPLSDWILTIILTSIPLVGFICLLVWALSSNTPLNKRNWAKANLIVMAAFAVIGIILLILFWGLIMASLVASSSN